MDWNWRYERTALTILVLANVAQLGARLVISPAVPAVIAAFGVSKGAVGLALTGMWAAFALLQYPGGVFASRFGERLMLLTSMSLVGVASLLLSGSPTFVLFSASVVLLGAGGAFFFTAAGPLISKLFDNTGWAFGVLSAGAAIAGLVGPAVAGVVTVRFGWRAVPLLGVGAASMGFVLVLRRVQPTAPNRPGLSIRDELRPGGGQVELLTRPRAIFSIVVAVAGAFTFQAFTSFFPTFLVEFHGFSIQQSGIAFGAVFLLSAVSQPLVGRMSDAYGRDSVLATVMVFAAGGFVIVLLSPRFAFVLLGLGLLGVGITWFGVINARFMDTLGDDEREIGFGLMRSVALLLGASGSVVTGAVVDSAGWLPAYGLVAGLLATACVLLVANSLFDLGL